MDLITPNQKPELTPPQDERVPRGWIHLAALTLLTLVGIFVCYRIVEPFLPALAWAVALAIMADPAHRWLARKIGNRNWAAVASTTLVVCAIVLPSLFVAFQLSREVATEGEHARAMFGTGWREMAARIPGVSELIQRAGPDFDLEQLIRSTIAQFTESGVLARGTVWALLQGLVTIFVLFFALRDRDHLLTGIRRFLPVTTSEADHLFKRTSDAVHATVYATIIVGLVQGVTGGLLFWALGLPSPLLWGVVMTVLSILPFVGAFLIWVPAAILLALDNRLGAAAILVVWGILMVGPITNWLYAVLAGNRMRMHPIPALLAFIGGLAVFGVSGMVLGPVALALTLALLGVWRHRAESGDTTHNSLELNRLQAT